MQGAVLSSVATEFYTGSHDSHVGILIVLRTPQERRQACEIIGGRSLPVGETVFLWEAIRGTHLTCTDIISREPRRTGTRLVALNERIAHNWDEFDMRLLRINGGGGQAVTAKLLQFFCSVKDWQFDNNALTMFRSAYDHGPLCDNLPPSKVGHVLFCSDGVGRALQAIGLLDESVNTRELTPSDFEFSTPILKMLKGARFEGPPLLLAQTRDTSSPLCRVLCSECVIV